MTGPPSRTPVERAKTWDYLGASWHQAGRYADAARAFGRAAETSRSQRLYLQWAIAARDAGDFAQEQRVLEDLVAFAPDPGVAWSQLGSLAWRRGDYATAARAAKELVRIAPNDAEVRQRAEYVERTSQNAIFLAGDEFKKFIAEDLERTKKVAADEGWLVAE